MSARFAVLDCEDQPKWHGHERFWIDPLRRDGEEWRSYRVWAGELPEVGSLAGAVITGSHYSVMDESLPWLPPLFDFVRAVAGSPDGPRLVGGCFGCQTIGRALGGAVGRNPHGRFVFGAERIALADRFVTAWFAPEQPAAVTLFESHGECVLELPPGAELLGRSASTAHEIFAVGDRILALQAHPELTREAMVDTILPSLRQDGRLDQAGEATALRSLESDRDDRLVMQVIRRFLDRPAR